jgi:hypothetical protein
MRARSRNGASRRPVFAKVVVDEPRDLSTESVGIEATVVDGGDQEVDGDARHPR